MTTDTKNGKIMEDLQDLGLNQYESKVYLSLTLGKSLTASQMANATGIPRSRVYDVLRGLVRMGLCIEIPGKVIGFRITDPDDSLTSMLYEKHQMYMKELEAKRSIAKNIAMVLRERPAADIDDFRKGGIEIFGNPSQMLKRYQSLIFNSEKEILVMGKLPFLQGSSDRTYEISKPGTEVHFLLDHRFRKKAPMVEEAILKLYGDWEHRVADDLPLKCGVFDGKTVWIVFSNGIGNVQGIVIHDLGMARILRSYFYKAWEGSEPLKRMETK